VASDNDRDERAEAAHVGDRSSWLAERPGQTTVPRAQLVDGIRKLLAEIDLA